MRLKSGGEGCWRDDENTGCSSRGLGFGSQHMVVHNCLYLWFQDIKKPFHRHTCRQNNTDFRKKKSGKGRIKQNSKKTKKRSLFQRAFNLIERENWKLSQFVRGQRPTLALADWNPAMDLFKLGAPTKTQKSQQWVREACGRGARSRRWECPRITIAPPQHRADR